MHIVYLTSEFTINNFHCGGLANYISNMANILTGNGHIVTIAITDRSSDKKKGFEWKKNIWIEYLRLIDLDVSFLNSSNRKTGFSFYYTLQGLTNNALIETKLFSIHQKRRIDVVQYSSELLVYAAKSCFFPSLVRITCLDFYFRLAYLPKFDFNNAEENINRRERMQLDSIGRSLVSIGPGKLFGSIAEKFSGKRVYIIESPFYSNKEIWNYEIYKGQLKDKKYILFFGSLGYIKGVYTIADIIYRIFDKYSDVYMVFAGKVRDINGAEDNRRRVYKVLCENAKQYADRIIFLGEIEKNSLYPVIEQAHFCLLPSRVDNLPNTCIESMGLGKIVIGTRGASFDQLIKDGYNGYLGERDNGQSYLEAIDKVMSLEEEEKELISKRAVNRIQKMNPETMYHKYYNLYQRVIRKFKK